MNILIGETNQYRTFGSYITELIGISKKLYSVSKTQEIILDFSKCQFSNPTLIAGLIILKEGLTSQGFNIRFNNEFLNRGFESYLQTIHFPNCVNPFLLTEEKYNTFLEKYRQLNYIPLTIYCRTEILELTRKRERFISSINGMLLSRCQLTGDVLNAIKYLIAEALDNILEHSMADFGIVFIQYYPKQGYIDLVIGDCGIGLLGSYQTRVDRYPNIATFSDAMQRAINGESTKDIPESRGFGISTSRKMLVEGLEGTYFLMSGSAFYIEHPKGRNLASVPDLNWKGVLLALRIPFKKLENFTFYDYVE